MKILILGGTKYSGFEVVKKLLLKNDCIITIASRREVENISTRKIDRKSLEDLIDLFKESFDFVIDFICFNKVDAEKLLKALKVNNQQPKIISISSTYVYQNLPINQAPYLESDFDPNQFEEIDLDWPEINYIDGKKSAEAYLLKNYPNELLCIFRFPIIFGRQDPTNRTQYFLDIIEKEKVVDFSKNFSGRSNFISKLDVSVAILNALSDFKFGIFNVAVDKAVNQDELYNIFLEIKNKNPTKANNVFVDFSTSPFYYPEDFIVCTKKFKDNFNLSFDNSNLSKDISNETSNFI